MKALCVHAHYDDYEFVVSGMFETWRQQQGSDLRRRLIVCTDCKAGHHFRTCEETGAMRLAEQERSAAIGQYEFELLKLPDGSAPREACLQVTPDLLAALWHSIRSFEPDYLFCPSLVSDPLAGIHNDHETVAEAVRRVAYMINVPHAFTVEYPTDETQSTPCNVPVILNLFDPYQQGSSSYDLVVDVESAFDAIAAMSWCHQSQITEWMPWVGRHGITPPSDLDDWKRMLRRQFATRNRQLGINSEQAVELFSVTSWGTVPTMEQIERDFPNILPEFSRLDVLAKRLEQWGADFAF